MNNFQLYIFDFDGTIVDTKQSILHCMLKTFDEMQYPSPEQQEIQKTIDLGLGLSESFTSLINSDHHIDDWITKYRQIYKTDSLEKLKVFPNVLETLHSLKSQNKTIIVVSNKGKEAIEQTLDHLSIAEFPSMVIGDTPGVLKKPDPMIFDKFILPNFSNIRPQNMIMIGDTEADIKFAQNCGMYSCWAAYGYGIPKTCAELRPNFIINSFKQISNLTHSKIEHHLVP